MNTKVLFLIGLIFTFFSLEAIDQDTRTKADKLLERKDYLSAYRLSDSILAADPNEAFGWRLRLNVSAALSKQKGKWPNECYQSAKKLGSLVPEEEVTSLVTAIWCLNDDSRYQEIVSLVPNVIPQSRIKIGDGNYGLLINVITIAYMKLNDQRSARNILYAGLSDLSGTPSALHTSYNVGELFFDPEMTMDEREKWHELFKNNLFKEQITNPLIPSIAWNTSILTDEYTKKGKYNFAYETISLLYPEMDLHVSKYWNFLRDQLWIKYKALQFKTKKTKEIPRKKLKLVILIVPKTRLKAPLPAPLTQYNLDLDLEEKSISDLVLSTEYFRDSFAEITEGIYWDYEIIRTDSEIRDTNLIKDTFRYVMQPSITSIQPPLAGDVLTKIKAADGVLLIWPGTKQPNGVLITNGGGTEWNFGTENDPEVRLTIISDSNKKIADGNHANHPIFLYHELFHVLEWAYHKSKFPKKDHPYMRRKDWPIDYVGNTEWDFYSETFRKRLLVEDKMDRVYWLGRKEGFYGIKIKEENKK
ncbi:hypothetical protein LEP1GSC202_2256 [Leptospira yanagawae serovar Saopaulo str. Sao Paulo = ATCC 700523]|uniref:Uncharacterized protein n=1 Tax=Leptospira yanagawae serovar Saopaulo str. Sao Paulo = ATCC 700523 TaxID=1249483 RepID=A0A5E8HB74_9LEPT|nr:hypothetical protein [Leptospira yanagawae]EOQ88469.1 hypothetical protein LEP1GSC202_2256 [Leptospira yanagawae serovar Saopaulo str. Sao Paulo = ATCC 700523]